MMNLHKGMSIDHESKTSAPTAIAAPGIQRAIWDDMDKDKDRSIWMVWSFYSHSRFTTWVICQYLAEIRKVLFLLEIG